MSIDLELLYCPQCGGELISHPDGIEPEDMRCANCELAYSLDYQAFTSQPRIDVYKAKE